MLRNTKLVSLLGRPRPGRYPSARGCRPGDAAGRSHPYRCPQCQHQVLRVRAPASLLSPELRQVALAQGSTRLENPSALTSHYGYDNDVLDSAGQPQMLPTPSSPTEAHKVKNGGGPACRPAPPVDTLPRPRSSG
jgi:hypothetical protein